MSNQASDSIRWDTTNPNVNITSPTSSTTYTSTSSLITLGGNASDSGSGLETTMSWTSDNQNNPAGTGSITSLGGWTASGIELNSVGTTTITITVKDKAGNKASDTILVTYASSSDTSAPSSTSISINGGSSYTKSTSVTLSLSAADSVGVTGYYLSTSSTKPTASALSGWTSVSSTTSYRANVSYSLSTGDGSKTVYVFYKDAAGNVSSGVNDSITLDTTAPTVSITSPAANPYPTSSSSITISGTALDSGSGISNVYWSNSATGLGANLGKVTSFTLSNVSLKKGVINVITVWANDGVLNTGKKELIVLYP